jgi:hypothetical protein
MAESFGCTILRWLSLAFDCPRSAPKTTIVVVGFGLAQDAPSPEGHEIMSRCNVGQFLPLVAKGMKDGVEVPFDGPAVFSFESEGVFEKVTDSNGLEYAKGIARGETTVGVDIDADVTAGVRTLHGVGLMICDDPHSNEADTVVLADADPIDELP